MTTVDLSKNYHTVVRMGALLAFSVFVIFTLVPWENFYSTAVSIRDAGAGISASHPLGADQLGRDLLARFSTAIKDTVVPLWGSAILATLAGVVLSGLAYVFEENKVVCLFMKATSSISAVALAIPFGVIVFSVSVYFEGISLAGILISGFCYILLKSYLRVNRLVDESKNLGYWEAHVSLGGTRLERFLKYGVLTDFRKAIAGEVGFHMRLLVAAEVTLSYLGFGVNEPNPSIGNILSSNIENALKGDPRILLTSVAVLILVMGIPSILCGIFNHKK